MDKPTRMERFRYWFDGWMSRGTVALMVLLGIATVVFVVVLGAITVLVLTLTQDRTNLPDDPGSVWTSSGAASCAPSTQARWAATRAGSSAS